MADDISEAKEEKVDDGRRAEFMAEKGDEWLLRLFYTMREHSNGKIKPYLDHDALVFHESKKARNEAYERGIQNKIQAERAAA